MGVECSDSLCPSLLTELMVIITRYVTTLCILNIHGSMGEPLPATGTSSLR